MGRVNSYTNVTHPETTDEILIDGAAGTRNMTLSDLAIALGGMISPDQHRNVWRGKMLGSTLTDEQKAAISSASFDDLYIGDYWVIDGVNYRIVDIDYWYRLGDTSCAKHHVVLMPDRPLYQDVMNDSNVTTGGYMLSKLRTKGLDNAKKTINSAFGAANVLNYRSYLINATTSGYPSAGAWDDSTVEIPNEIMIFGSYISASVNTGNGAALMDTMDNKQLAGMRMGSALAPARDNWWIRDIVSSSKFSCFMSNGITHWADASASRGVRPVFGITGGN